MNPVKALIFDCDGVLIDSEIVVCRLVAESFTRLGHPLAVEDVIRRFAGRPEPDMIAEIERDWGRPVPPEYFDAIRARTAEAYATELRAVPHAAETLRRIKVPVCVASSSYPEKLRLGLESVGLYDRFAPNLVSATYVARGKPAPDVFVYAAGWMRTPIAECLVVEDSLPGVRAAKAAGLRVVGFTGGAHCGPEHRDRLIEAGAEQVLADFRELEGLLPAAFRTE
jgi:HAD superfamily hydrolase (TIGR01509 family)